VSSIYILFIRLYIYWLRTWTVLQKPGTWDMVLAICHRLEQVLLEYFSHTHECRSVFGLDTIRV
jgi:hypothetical protein